MGGMRVRAASLVAAAGLLLSGCTGAAADPEDSGSGEPTASMSAPASSSPSPSVPAKPERPEAMERKDAEGAAAAAEYFLSLYTYTKSTGDTEEWDSMSHKTCDFCKITSDRAKEIEENGESFAGGDLTMRVLETYARDGLTGIYPLDVRMTQAPYTTRGADGEVTRSDEAVGGRRIEMGRKDNHWVVVAVAPIPGADS